MRRYRFLAIVPPWAPSAGLTLATTGHRRLSSGRGRRATPAAPQLAAGDTALVSVALPSRADVESLIGSGVEVEGAALPLPGGAYQVDAVLTGAQVAALTSNGARLLRIIERQGDGSARYLASVQAAQARTAAGLTTVRAATLANGAVSTVNTDTLHFLQNYWWTSQGPDLRRHRGGHHGDRGPERPDHRHLADRRRPDRVLPAAAVQRRQRVPVPLRRLRSRCRPSRCPSSPPRAWAARTTATPQAWPGVQPPPTPAGYQQDFITQYMTPEDVTARIQRLAHQYPSLVDVINLPNKTQGYRRTASGYLGNPATAAVIVESVQFGDQGWNGVQVKSVKPAGHNRPLTVHYANRTLTVSLATNSKGAVTSTTGQVAAAIRSSVGSKFHAYVKSGQAGKIVPVSGPRP